MSGRDRSQEPAPDKEPKQSAPAEGKDQHLSAASSSTGARVPSGAHAPDPESLGAHFPTPELPFVTEKVENLKAGDLVDLESCPHLKNHPMAEFEYAEVSFVEKETDNCILVGYEGIDHVGYAPGTELRICRAEDRGIPELALPLDPNPYPDRHTPGDWVADDGFVFAPGVRVADATPNTEDPEMSDETFEANIQLLAASPRMKALLVKAMAYEAEAFAADGEVNGADLVDFFARWRQEAHTLLRDVCKTSTPEAK